MNYQVFMTYNTDDSGNRVAENIYNEEYNIYSSRIVLNQIPDNFFGVSIENDSIPMVEIKNKSKELGAGEFFVDYSTGLIRFNSTLEGVTIMVTEYSGIGFISYPADRIYTKTNGTMISETLADLAINASPVVIMLGELQDAEDLRVIAENSRVSAEDIRLSDESDRISAEDLRLSAEINRISSETDRLNAESSRLTNESTRISSEDDRISEESDRLANEALRIPAENTRLASEVIRVSSEDTRVSNEDIRISSESDRVSAEDLRLPAEINRINSEISRESLESNRVIAENVRITNENSRVDIEILRVDAEDIRDDTETDRNTAETNRDDAEIIRISNEDIRISNEDIRIINEDERKQFEFLGDYDNGYQYLTRNTILYNGSSYVCILDSLGNLPTDVIYWTMVAERGNDGDMVKSVYDPTFIEASVFDMDNMVEAATKKILTDSERTQIGLIDGKSDDGHTHVEADITDLQSYELTSNKGIANGYAELDSNGFVPSAQLPSYVDDVLSYANYASFPGTGENSKVYIDEDTNITYRWSGSAYIIIGTDLALGETENMAYRGDRGKTAYDHSQVIVGNPHGTVLGDLGYTGEIDATADQTDAEIKTAYENNADTNAYTDTEQTKMGYITVTQAVDLDNLSVSGTSIENIEAKTDFITVTQDVDLDTMETNINTNNNKISYPGSADATELNILDGATLSTAELNYVDGVTSNIQTQLNGKLASGSNAVSATKLATARTIDITGDITATAVSFDGTANIAISAAVNDDSHNHIMSNVDGLQTALDSKQASGTYNTIIGTNTDINTSGSTIVDYITVTDGVITAMGTRALTPADIGTRKITSGTANPSGGASGDVYFQYE